MMELQALDSALRDLSGNSGNIVVALSGGVDSSLVAARVYALFGDTSRAVTVRSRFTPSREMERALVVAGHIGIPHVVIDMDALGSRQIRANGKDRCYHCKRAMLEAVSARFPGWLIADGTNADDDPARPGLRALAERGAVSPLRCAGLSKAEIIALARALRLPNCDVPSESCLATRIPFGVALDAAGLERVEIMESFFHERGVETLRARHDNLVATVEHLGQYAEIMENNHDNFAALIKRIGLRSYRFREWRP